MRSDRLRLDILDAIGEVARYLPADRAEFDANPLLQSHIFRHVMIRRRGDMDFVPAS